MSTSSLNLIQQQHVLNNHILIADYLSSSFFTTVKNALFISCCWRIIAFIICCWFSCSCCFTRNSRCLLVISDRSFLSQKVDQCFCTSRLTTFWRSSTFVWIAFLGFFKALHRFFSDIFCSLVVLELLFRCRFCLCLYGISVLFRLTSRSVIPSPLTLPQKSRLPSLPRSSFCWNFFGEGSTALAQLSYPSVWILESEFHSDCRLSLPKPVHERDFLSLFQKHFLLAFISEKAHHVLRSTPSA